MSIVLLAVEYMRDDLGRIVQRTETFGASAGGGTRIFEYGYDLAGRLQAVSEDGVHIAQYEYDANGNRLSKSDPSLPGSEMAGEYDAQDRLLSYGAASYTYSANGELTTKTTPSGTTTYAYDALGNLRAVVLPDGREIAYTVDGENHRLWKTIDGVQVQGFLWRNPLQIVAELDAAGERRRPLRLRRPDNQRSGLHGHGERHLPDPEGPPRQPEARPASSYSFMDILSSRVHLCTGDIDNMTTAVLRVSGPKLDLDKCLKWIPHASLELSWRVGEKKRNGEIRTTSGFNLLLADGEDSSKVVEDTMKAFRVVASSVGQLVRSGASAEIDFALYVYEIQGQSISLSPEFLRLASEHDVGVVVSAYPCSDEDDE